VLCETRITTAIRPFLADPVRGIAKHIQAVVLNDDFLSPAFLNFVIPALRYPRPDTQDVGIVVNLQR
jgi:hypothetical protein